MSSAPNLPPLDESWAPPSEFHEYRLSKALGRGRTGRVYLAHDTLLERAVAVKFIPAGSPDAMERLLNEARAAARLQHPNVVTLYRVGQLDDYAYIVTEYTRGTSLDRLPKPQPSERVHQIAIDLARGLAASHRAGVLHRDLKPGNAVMAEDGTAKLLDFGLAKLVEQANPARPPTPAPIARPSTLELASLTSVSRGDLVGTPYYMPPEAWRGEEHTARSDLYSLGALLYELCSGRAPFRHVMLHELPDVVQTQSPPPLAELAPGIDSMFAAAIERCLEPDPLERFPNAEALLDVLEAAATPAAIDVPEGNPYRGLRPFEPEHRVFFFGRSRDLREIRDRLRGEPFVLLAGDSGVGKSSLAAAGLLPEIEAGALGTERTWRAARLVPGRSPLAALADATAHALGLDSVELESALRHEPEGFARRLRARLRSERGLVIYIDQLEELVTLAEPGDAAKFALAIASLAGGAPGLKLLATSRSDFLTRLAALPRIGPPLARAIHLVRPLDPEDLREAVTGPARVKGVRFESDALIDELVRSAGAAGGGLPLLQFALAELWERRDEAKQQITASALTALGGVAGALALHADEVIDALLPDQRKAARSLLLRLVTDDGTRARRTGDELTGRDDRHRAALEALVRGRLLVARDSEAGTTYEVAHEALLVGWSRLARWIAEDAEHRSVRRRLEAAALEWERLGMHPEALWGPQAVAEALALDHDSLPERERNFLHESQRGLARRRRLQIAVAGCVGLLVLAAGGVVELRARLDRKKRVDAELQLAAAALAKADADIAQENAARAEAFADFDHARGDDGEKAWARTLSERHLADSALAEAGEHLERAGALGADRADVNAALCEYMLRRAIRAEQQGREDLRDLFAQRLAGLDTDGHFLKLFQTPSVLTVSAEGSAHIRIARYEPGTDDRLVEKPLPLGITPGRPLELPPGSYVLVREGPRPTRLPVLLERGVHREVELPEAPETPSGFVYVPAGRFQFGTAGDENVRQLMETVPAHEVLSPAFFIGRTEVTWRDYLAYLDDLSGPERLARMPHLAASNAGAAFGVRKVDGTWELTLQPGTVVMHARAGELLHYPGRKLRADVDWLNLPAVGVSYDDAEAFAAWLSRTNRVPGAHVCTEQEWERAARGADLREFSEGPRLGPDDANYDVTYGRDPQGVGPDEAGAHPVSMSPFGVMDLTGNVWEWTRSVLEPGKVLLRGGSYFHDVTTCRATNRNPVDHAYRNMTVGMRLCSSSPR
ncbi:MAG: SUMF1/EgtB/PvdO family nonheme iron enzyme [Deltaproteobacteria bacterium]|nr:SUMF1/EgtB/PvdO family nonheme iron enzyme [Deltaproteobacteria bacterium]